MRRLVCLTLFATLTLTGSAATASPRKIRGPFPLVTLPSLGTVTWRCDPDRRPGLAQGWPSLALGFRSPRASATTRLRLHVRGRTIARRVVQPGSSTELPYLQSRVQHLELVQFTGAGTLRAFVKVSFVSPATATYCYPYLQPRVDVRLLPRQ
jgi:hypothetical protein